MWLFLFVLLAPFTPAIDLYTAHLFYTSGVGFADHFVFSILFRYGELFGLGTGGVASGVFLLSYVKPQWQKWRSGSCAIVLTLVVGAGLITNMGFKEYWGRPRPKQITEFGGKHEYRPFWKPNLNPTREAQKSFPSGHVAVGFYFLSVMLVGKRYRNPLLFYSGLGLTLLLGGGLMMARVAQGGHFVSDVLASALVMWYVSLLIHKITWGAPMQRLLGVRSHDTSAALDRGESA